MATLHEIIAGITKLQYVGFTSKELALEINRADREKEVQEELDALLCDCRGKHSLKESEGGVLVVYEFPQNFKTRLYKKRAWLSFTEKFLPKVLSVLKLFIGVCLIFSISMCVVLLFLFALRNGLSGSRGQTSAILNSYNAFVLYSFWRRNPFLRQTSFPAPNTTSGESLQESLAEEVFSFLFGPPYKGVEDHAWNCVKDEIARSGFLISAEKLRPFAHDISELEEDRFMGRIVSRLNGQPVPSSQGRGILYRFESLENQYLVSNRTKTTGCNAKYFREPLWVFSDRSYTLAAALGAVNILALIAISPYVFEIHASSYKRTPKLRGFYSIDYSPSALDTYGPILGSLLLMIKLLFYALAVYAVLFFLIPAIRYLVCIQILNPRIKARNDFRANLVNEQITD